MYFAQLILTAGKAALKFAYIALMPTEQGATLEDLLAAQVALLQALAALLDEESNPHLEDLN